MSAYTTLSEAVQTARTVITQRSATSSWPRAALDLALADVAAAEATADGWFTTDEEETAAFWSALHERYASWDGSLDGMDKIGSWLASAGYASQEAAATVEAQSTSAILSDTLAAAGEDVTTIATTATDNKTLILVGAAILAFVVWKVIR